MTRRAEGIKSLERLRKSGLSGKFVRLAALVFVACCAVAQAAFTGSQISAWPGATELVQPAQLASSLKSVARDRPLIIQVGFRVLYVQAHIPGSEFIGPGSSPDAIRQLHRRVESLPRTQSIVLYCGCCPWDRCPNIKPAFAELHSMGFHNVKVLYVAQNFGKDWVDKGYPVDRSDQKAPGQR